MQGATLNAFEANGHKENGDPSNPYTETVSRGMNYMIARLVAEPIVAQTVGGLGGEDRNDNPDSNGNGLGISTDSATKNNIRGDVRPYQLGMIIDAMVAAGTPGAVADTGPENVIGRTYGDIVQDMVDWYAMAQSDTNLHGGWWYNQMNNTAGAHDNSTAGWAATGIVAAEDVFGATVPAWVKIRNMNGLEYTDNESDTSDSLSSGDGVHGYTSDGADVDGRHRSHVVYNSRRTLDSNRKFLPQKLGQPKRE